MNRDFWKGKKVFLTGHTGFKGSWASVWLHDMGAEVYGYSLAAPTEPSLYEKAKIGQKLKSKIANICDYPILRNAMIEANPDVVLHMAAQPLVRYSYDNPIETYATNVMGTVHVLEAARQAKNVRAVVAVTTDKCYENKERLEGYREDEAMGGYDPYSSSKGCSELVVAAMRRSFFNPSETSVASARAGNVIGGGDWALDRLVPDFMRSFHRHEPVLVRNPNAIRPWQHVMEPLAGYFTLAESLFESGAQFAEGWNFGPRESDAKDVRYIADKLVQLWGDDARWQLDGANHPHEAHYLKLNIEKATHRLNWAPRLNIDQALKLTCDWYREFYVNGVDAFELTLNQIRHFELEKSCQQNKN